MTRLDGFWKPLLASFVVLFVFACSGGGCSGCAGCGITPIPGGFPTDQPRIANSGQIRLSESGIQFIEDNIGDIVGTFLEGGLTFAIPRTDFDETVSGTICPDGGCMARAEIQDLQLTPTAPNTLHAVIQVLVDSRNSSGARAPIPVDVDLWLSTPRLNLDLDTSQGSRTFVALETDITFVTETRTPRTGFTRIQIGDIGLVDGQGIENDDIDISGSGVSGTIVAFVLDFFKGTLVGLLRDQLSSTLNGAFDDQLCTTAGDTGCPTGTVADGSGADAICRFSSGGECVPMLLGTDGQGDLGAAFLGAISPGTHAPIRLVLASGGDGVAVNSGMSLYMTGGFLSYDRTFTTTPGHNPCVPVREQPAVPEIARVPSFQGNVVPGSSAPAHLGIGIAEDYLNYAGYGMYDSGMFCLGVGTSLSQQLSTGLFSALVGTLTSLTYPEGASPLSLAVRPQQPPVFTIGTTSEDALLTVTLPEVQIDFYVWSQERYIRFMTYQTDLVLGIDLEAADGQLVPTITQVSPTNSSVLNSEILVENPTALASTIETVISTFAGMLGSSISPISLPEVMGFNIDVQAIQGVQDGDDRFLGIFANLALAGSALSAPVDTTLELSDVEILPESMGEATFDQNGRNSVWLHFGGENAGTNELEYSYRIDGGLWSPWTTSRRIRIEDRILLFQAHHEIEARARVVGSPLSVDATPARAELLIDVLAPMLELEESDAGGIHIIAEDIVSADDRLQMRYRPIDSESWTEWASVTDLDAVLGDVVVEVRDEAGNVATSSSPLIRGIPNPSNTSGCGCRVTSTSASSNAGLAGLVLVLATVVARRRSRSKDGSEGARAPQRRARPFGAASRMRRSLVGAAFGLAVLTASGCDCGGGTGGDGGVADGAMACGSETCSPARPPGDTTGAICCTEQLMCVDYDLEDLCDPGFECALEDVAVDGSCEVSCSNCTEKDPLEPGLLATFLDLAVAGDTWFVSGYSAGVPPRGEPYGDLVFGTYSGTGDVAWEIVDGAPTSPITAGPSGWRGGVEEPGDDVGQYTSMVRSADGTFYIAYYDATNTALKIAIGSAGSWSIHTVDATEDSGRYTSIALLPSGAPAIAYQRIEPSTDGSGHVHSAVRVAIAASATPSGTADWTSTEISSLDGVCRPAFCGDGQSCLEAGTCVTPTSDCSAACGDGEVCVLGACQAALADDYVEDLFPGRGLYTALANAGSGLALAFYDRSEGNLYGAAFDGTSWGSAFLIDGYGAGNGDSGLSASVTVDDAGTWHVAYVDGTDEVLRYAQVSGGTVTVREAVDDGATDGVTPHTDGRHVVGDDASIVIAAGGEVRIAYQDATSHTAMLARRSGTSWSKAVVDDENHTGFWIEQVPTSAGSRVVTWWRLQMSRETENGLHFIVAE